MTVIRCWRVCIAALVGGFVTVATSLVAIVTYLLQMRHTGNMWVRHSWGRVGMTLTHGILGRTLVVHDAIGQLDPDRPVIMIGNHPQTTDVMAYAAATSHATPSREGYPVVKIQSVWNPVGIACVCIGAIAIDRSKGTSAAEQIKQWAAKKGGHVSIVIFPCGRRSTKGRRLQSLQQLMEKSPDEETRQRAASMCDVTMPPKVRGVLAIAQAIPNAQWVLVSTANTGQTEKIGDLWRVPPGDVHIHMQRIGVMPQDYEGAKAYLWQLWEEHVIPHILETAVLPRSRRLVGGAMMYKQRSS